MIDATEQLLQLFTANAIAPARFALRATPAMVEIAEADGNGADLADWATSTRTRATSSARSSPSTSRSATPTTCNDRSRVYRGPVVAVVNANTFSCGDLFAAGIADYGIGQVVSVGEGTGAGGANVWTSDDIQYAYHAAGRPLPPIPPGISFTVSVRRMTRSGAIRRPRHRGHRRQRRRTLRHDRNRPHRRQHRPRRVLHRTPDVDLGRQLEITAAGVPAWVRRRAGCGPAVLALGLSHPLVELVETTAARAGTGVITIESRSRNLCGYQGSRAFDCRWSMVELIPR